MLGESTLFVLGENEVAIDGDVKDAAAAFNEFGGDAEFLFDRIRQTGGFGMVVSLHAVLDADGHG